MATVRKAVIAAAGFGTRFLPQTKAMPKEMLPLIDKPIIQYIVEELVEVGITDIIIVSSYQKRAIEDHFDVPSAELAANLVEGGKEETLAKLHEIANMANFIYVRQKEPLGNAAPLLYAKHLIDNEPFIYTWGDDFIKAKPARFQQMIDSYDQTGGSIVSCVRVEDDESYDRYGIVSGTEEGEGLLRMDKIVEKPGKQNAPSNLASVSGYLFDSKVLDYVEESAKNHDGKDELKVQSAMQAMIDDGYKYYACEIKDAKFYDAGNKLEYLKTVVDFALMHDDIREDFRDHLRSLVKDLD